MRVLIFSTAYLPLIGGAELAVKEITDRLPDIEFVMITSRLRLNLAEHEKIGNVSIYRIGRGNGLDKFRLIFSGWKKAQSLGKFDLLWSIMASHGGFAALRYKRRNRSIPFLLTLQEGDSKWHIYKHVWWCWPYFKQIFKRADGIQAISQYLARWAKELGATCAVRVIPNGVDVARFVSAAVSLSHEEKMYVRKQMGIRPENKVVISVSRLEKKNGLGDLIQSLALLPSHTHLIIAGSGRLEGELKVAAEKSGLRDRVHFVGDVAHSALPHYLAVADVFCRPSLSEGLGTAFLEAMAAGVPVVATPVGGIPDFLTDGETGLVCRQQNQSDIAAKIRRIFDDSDFAEHIRLHARNLVVEHYNWDSIAKSLGALMKGMV